MLKQQGVLQNLKIQLMNYKNNSKIINLAIDFLYRCVTIEL